MGTPRIIGILGRLTTREVNTGLFSEAFRHHHLRTTASTHPDYLNINHSQEAVKLLQERNRKSEAAAVASLPLLELPLVEVVGNDGLQHVGAGAEPHAGISQCSGFLQRRHRSLDFNVVDAEL